MIRVCGHIPSPDERRAWHPLARLLGGDRVADGPATTGVDRSDLVTHIEDQGQTGSCVWQARARAVDLVARAAGVPIEWRSVQFGYALTRMLERPDVYQPIVDEGCTPAIAAMVATQWGMPPASLLPFDPATINSEPSVTQFIAAADHVLDGEYVIDGDDRARGIATALDIAHFATLAILVDEGFDNTGGITPVGLPHGKTRGWHDVCAVGYVAVNGVVVAIKIVNSWSIGWGAGGFAWLSAERVNHSTTRSVQCFVTKPR